MRPLIEVLAEKVGVLEDEVGRLQAALAYLLDRLQNGSVPEEDRVIVPGIVAGTHDKDGQPVQPAPGA